MHLVQTVMAEGHVKDLGPLPYLRVSRETPLREVVRRMAEERRAVVIVEDGRACGIFTERDLLRIGLEQDPLNDRAIADVMTRRPISIRTEASLRHAVRAMHQNGCRHLVVTEEDGTFLGVLTSQDLIAHVTQHFPREVVNRPSHLRQVFDRPEGG